MKKIKELSKIFTLMIAVAIMMFSCVEDDYDKPVIPQIPTGDIYTIQEVKDFFINNSNSMYTFTDTASVYATVTMDNETDNSYRTFFIQDNTAAIAVFQDVSGGVYIGDSVRIYLKDLVVMQYQNLFQINNVAGDGVSVDDVIIKQGYNTKRVPEEATIAQINADPVYYQGRLVKITDIQFVDTDTAKTLANAATLETEERLIQDANDKTLIVRTSGYATFANAEVPDGSGSLVAIVGQYGDNIQLYIRRISEVEMDNERFEVAGGGGGGGIPVDPVASVNEDFSLAEDYTDIAINGWTNTVVQGDRKWQGKTFNSEKYIQASGYNSGLDAMETWIITPPVTDISTKVLSFKSAKAYWAHETGDKPLTVYVSTDFVGDNFATATWNELNVTIAGESSSDHVWVESGEVDLSAYTGNAAIAFKYLGSDTKSTTIRLDDIKIDVSGGGGGVTAFFEESFSSSLGNFSQYSITGASQVWGHSSSFQCAMMTGYDSNTSSRYENNDWLISPAMDFAGRTSVALSFDHAIGYGNYAGIEDELKVFVSEDYSGSGDPSSASWVELTFAMPADINDYFAWTNSGNLDLSAYDGKTNVYFAFNYNCGTVSASTWEIKNVAVSESAK